MKYIDEFRDSAAADKILNEINRTAVKQHNIMEVCGGQTHTLIQYGIDRLLPDNVQMIHGPGCPVCVTPLETIDRAIEIAGRPGVIFTSFGDMLRVPGSSSDLFDVRSKGGDVRIVYSPLEAVKTARENPDKEVVFFAIGFETTAPGNAMAIMQAAREGLNNFTELVSHVLVPPAMEAVLSSPDNIVNAFLAAGHVCTVMGYKDYEPIAEKFNVPIVPTGFEPLDLLQGILMTVRQREEGKAFVENQYTRSVTREGNPTARKTINEVYEVCHRKWRGIGGIPKSGMKIKDKYSSYDAELRFEVSGIKTEEPEICISGEVLQGLKKPFECEAFGKECTPQHPLGATMVSGEGACAAYYKYHRYQTAE